ncbi:sulfatase family protein [Flavicella marina]|uniref:sulfatase family protein n=1 Tax=Flavicella marina TaxID=1475951 RepID=UPI00126473E0|nr:sulfatase [Flavicella marina]
MKKLILIIVACISIASHAQVQQPNILWIVCEDISPTLSMYGDAAAKTPHLDAFAKEAMVFDNAFATVGVCAPSRSSIITGMYATSIGTMHMRTGMDIQSWGKRTYKTGIPITDINGDSIIQYAAVVPAEVKCFPEYLRAAGYFCTNNQKTDYQFAAPVTAWDQNNNKAHWRNAPKGKPFFSVFNIDLTHESKLWKHDKLPLTVDPAQVKVPPYLQDTETSRKTIARNYSNIELMDKKFGAIVAELKKDGLYDNTIIFFYSDHGGPLPRQKREILDSGLKVPFMVKSLNSEISGRTDQMISFVDLAPTILSLAHLKSPKYMDGQAFLGAYNAKERVYVYGSSDRFDEFTDRIRSVRDKQYLYLKNYYPDLKKYKDVGYRKQVPLMVDLLSLASKDELNNLQMIWFGDKTTEELYDCKEDPFNLNNLAEDPAYTTQLKRMRKALKAQKNKDYADISESEMIAEMWPGNKQPQTSAVTVKQKKKTIQLCTETKGASIVYYIAKKNNLKLDFNSGWQLYSKPLTLEKGVYLYTMAERIGFKESEILITKIN